MVRPSILQTTTTNPNYDREAAGNLSRGLADHLLALMRPGGLIVQTRQQAERTRQLSQQLGERGQPQDPMAMVVQAILQARSQHWNRGVFLIAHSVPGGAVDGSDTVVAFNLCRAATDPMPREVSANCGRWVGST